MTNSTIMNGTYDIQGLLSIDPVTSGPSFIITLNNLLGGWAIVIFIAILALILFLLSRQLEGVSDTRAGMYAGLVVSVIGLFMVLIDFNGSKLLTFSQWVPFFVITIIFVFVDKVNKNY